MASKIMLEVTQAIVDGNEVAVHSGELFEPDAKLPDGVTVRPVIVEADGTVRSGIVQPAAEEPEATAARPGVAEADQQPRRGASKGASK